MACPWLRSVLILLVTLFQVTGALHAGFQNPSTGRGCITLQTSSANGAVTWRATYRDLGHGVFLARVPAGFVDGPSLYAYLPEDGKKSKSNGDGGDPSGGGGSSGKCFVAGTLVAVDGGFKPIESLVVGDRVLTSPEEHQISDTEIEPAEWRKVSVEIADQDHPTETYHISILRPAQLVDDGWSPGETVWFEIEELDLASNATIISVEQCPELAVGQGRVVTMTMAHRNASVRAMYVDGVKPIQATRSHPFYSPSRGGWTRVKDFDAGDTLLARDGTERRLREIKVVPGIHMVYNIEVEGDHRYYVTPQQLLSHNATACSNAPGGGATPHIRTTSRTDAGPTGQPNSIVEQTRPDGGRSVTYYDDQGRRFSREDYGQTRPHRGVSNGPDGKPVPHEHGYTYSDKGPTGKRIRELDNNGKPITNWKDD